MRYILTLLLLSATMFRTAAQENYTLADTLTLDTVVVTGVTLTSMTDEGNLRFNVSKIEGNTGADILRKLRMTSPPATSSDTINNGSKASGKAESISRLHPPLTTHRKKWHPLR
jgi:hypothetical protein